MIRVDELPEATIRAARIRLVQQYGPPTKGRTPEDWEGELRRGTRGWSTAELTRALDDLIDSRRTTFFPAVGEIRAHRPPPTRSVEPDHRPASSACQRCGQEAYLAGYQTRARWHQQGAGRWATGDGAVRGRYRCGCVGSAQSANWHTPAATAWQDSEDEIRALALPPHLIDHLLRDFRQRTTSAVTTAHDWSVP